MFREVENRKRATTNPEERRKLEEKQKEIGQKGDLARPDTRAEYDRKNAHLRFFVPQPAAARMYLEKIDRLFALDRAARRFLREKNVNVAPLCDLDRTDFAADQERVDLLERLLE